MHKAYIDAHLHLQDTRIPRPAAALKEAHQAGIALRFCNAVRESEWQVILELGRTFDSVIPFLGIHPWFAEAADPGWDRRLSNSLNNYSGLFGIGEVGLDKYANRDLTKQLHVFKRQLDLAHELSCPLAVHCVRSWGILVDILESASNDNRLSSIMIHSFNGSHEVMQRLIRIGCFISYSPTVADPRYKKRHELFRCTPLEHLLLETDAPGKPARSTNQENAFHLNWQMPARLPGFYAWGAQMREITLEKFTNQLYRNAQVYTNRASRR